MNSVDAFKLFWMFTVAAGTLFGFRVGRIWHR